MQLISGILVLLLTISWCSLSSSQICKFHHLDADCRYRIDQISLSHIQASIQQCEDPVQLQLTITNGNPSVYWKGTFDKIIDRRSVEGFDSSVFVIVQLGYDKSDGNKFHVDIDFVVEGVPDKIDLIDEKKKLITDGCIVLNQAAKIAVGVLVPIFVLAFLGVIIVLVLRRRQLNKRNSARSELVTNAHQPSQTDPPSTTVEGATDHMNDPVTNSYQNGRTGNAYSNGLPLSVQNNTVSDTETNNHVVTFSGYVNEENALNC